MKTGPLLAIILLLQSWEMMSAKGLAKLHLKLPSGEAKLRGNTAHDRANREGGRR